MNIKKGLEKEFEQAKAKNTDEYGAEIYRVVEKVGQGLDEGKTPQEAEDFGVEGSDITGFMAGAIAVIIAHFHSRGEEFKTYFNKQMGGTGEEKGTINPAILEIKD